MCLSVDIEVDAMNRCTRVLVLEHTLCTITEWDDAKAFSTYRNALCEVIHCRIADVLRSNCTLHPCVEDTSTIDTEKNTKTSVRLIVVDVSECVHAAELVVVNLAKYTINNT